MAGPRREPQDRPDGLLAGYAPLPGVPDEMVDASGALRPAWSGLVETLSTLTPEQIRRRTAHGETYLRDAGVYFRQYGPENADLRDWPLSQFPVLLPEGEWRAIADAVIQRADLLEDVLADIYGENRLVADDFLPAALIAQNPEWLRPLVGVSPRSGHFLHFIAFEIGRAPDGRWWVLGDRTQAPSGAGFALENRVAMTRSFPDLIRQSNVHRLAGFFRAFREALADLCAEPDSRAAILTPGPMTDTYYEHAYIARYLGMMLLEGDDLTVQDGRVMIRTVAGPRPVSVLWRRLDATWADPLELNEQSRLGTPGLVGAIAGGGMTMVNALGAGILETRALLAFLPRISKALHGRPLAMPNTATWWCGQPAERAHVRANAHRLMIGPAFSTRLPLELEDTAALEGRLMDARHASIDALLDADGASLVGQELVTLSTTPSWEGGRLVPRPMSIRMFLARTAEGWQVMPGGFARIGGSSDPTAIAMHRGGSVADVWVSATAPVAHDSMLPQSSAPYTRPEVGGLPSRAADNLFWLGRYVERAEGMMRQIRAYHGRLADAQDADAPLMLHLHGHLAGQGVDLASPLPDGLRETVRAAVRSAGQVRDRFSVDGWNALNDLAMTQERLAPRIAAGDDCARAMSVLLRKISGFSGLVHDNMYRFTGWRFLTMGRSLERAHAMAQTLAVFADPAAPHGGYELALELGDSALTHRRRYSVTASRGSVVDLLALDTLNPRAILCHLTLIRDEVAFLPGAEVAGRISDLSRAVLRVQAGLSVRTPQTLGTRVLVRLAADIAGLHNDISDAYLR